MSHYGPPGGPYGARSEPPGGSGQPPYGPPADPWGHRQDSWGDLTVPQPGYREPPPAGPAYPGPPPAGPTYPAHHPTGGWGLPPEEPPHEWSATGPRRRGRLVFTLVAVLVVVLAAAAGSVLFLVSGEDGPSSAGPAEGTVDPTGPAPPTGAPDSAEATPNDNIGMNAAMAQVDDCVVNDGTEQDVQLRIIRCDDGAADGAGFKVLAVFTEKVTGDEQERLAQAQQICEDTEGYTHHYYEVGENVAPSFILCMAQQD